MDVEKLFNGIAVIIDDEVNQIETSISKIRNIIINKNIPVAVYDDIPQLEVIPSLSNASFVILDWDFTKANMSVDDDERISLPSSLVFLKKIF